jgi:4'-phosphopantetheinyl transferase
VLKYYHVKDAKMALASHLLKHLVITKYCGVPWAESKVTRDKNGKPYFAPAGDSSEDNHIEFNVSHQAGIVSLIAVVGRKGVNVGTDVVCVNERESHDYSYIGKEGFFAWVDIHADVFADSEVQSMKVGSVANFSLRAGALEGLEESKMEPLSKCQWRDQELQVELGDKKVVVDSNLVIDAKLRGFYAMWCLREAYVKMTGEALLAPWLKELEIFGFKAPSAPRIRPSDDSLEEGDICASFNIRFKGNLVLNVRMELSALGENYMVGGAVRVNEGIGGSDLKLGKWTELNLEADILAFGGPISG